MLGRETLLLPHGTMSHGALHLTVCIVALAAAAHAAPNGNGQSPFPIVLTKNTTGTQGLCSERPADSDLWEPCYELKTYKTGRVLVELEADEPYCTSPLMSLPAPELWSPT